jgi:hypothetical protein
VARETDRQSPLSLVGGEKDRDTVVQSETGPIRLRFRWSLKETLHGVGVMDHPDGVRQKEDRDGENLTV